MRLFSTVVSSSHVYPVVDTNDNKDVRRLLEVAILPVLEVTLEEYRSRSLTPAERRSVSDAIRFCRAIRLPSQQRWSENQLGAHVVINMNTGKSVVLVAWEGYGDYRFYGSLWR